MQNMNSSCNTNNSREKLTMKIQEYSFAVLELNLFLNSHPHNKQALMHRKKYLEELRRLTEAYETSYGPLTAYSTVPCDEWTWVNEPWPWETDN